MLVRVRDRELSLSSQHKANVSLAYHLVCNLFGPAEGFQDAGNSSIQRKNTISTASSAFQGRFSTEQYHQ